MIKEFVETFEANKAGLRQSFVEREPRSYQDLVERLAEILPYLDPNRVHCIDDGEYQGTLLFVIAEEGYQPFDYWYVKVSYGSCSGCDTFQRIQDGPDSVRPDEYMTLALHIVQGLKSMQTND